MPGGNQYKERWSLELATDLFNKAIEMAYEEGVYLVRDTKMQGNKYHYLGEIATSKEFYEKVETSFNWIGKNKEDVFMISFYAWLKAKMTKQDVYAVTLDLIKK